VLTRPLKRLDPSGPGFSFSLPCRPWDTSIKVRKRKRNQPKPDLSDAEVRSVLVNAMAEVGADPALVYAFRKTGVYVCLENEKRLPKSSLRAFDAAVDEYYAALARPPQ